MKGTREVLRLLAAEWNNPSGALVRHFASQIYEGIKTKAVLEQFERATRKAMHQFLAQQISDRLKSALSATDDSEPVDGPQTGPAASEATDNGIVIVTTEEEWRAYYIVQAILMSDVPADRVTLRGAKHSCSVLLDNTNRKPICRLSLNTAQKRLGLINAEKSEECVSIDHVSDIFAHAGRIQETTRRYLEKAVQPAAAP